MAKGEQWVTKIDLYNYFAYGSNMSLKRLGKRITSASYMRTYSLRENTFKFHKVGKDGSAKCDGFYTGKDTDIVHGVLYTISIEEKKLLDEVEGPGNGYEEKMVDVFRKGKGVESAFLYYATNIDDAILPFCWYVHHVLYGAVQAQLPASYIKKIADVTSVKDSDIKRDSLERSLYVGEELTLPAFDEREEDT